MHHPPFNRRPLLQELNRLGVRITNQRRTVIETIQEAHGHVDAATLFTLSRQRDARIDRATVYRTLELLKRLRLIDELYISQTDGPKHYYEVKTTVDHAHLACYQCGRIEELSSPLFEALKDDLRQRSGFEIRMIRLEVGGHCSSCTTAPGPVAPAITD